ncbi:MAG: hypothetical protein R3A47_04035 [Polyangiales bacterium]
MANIRTPVLIEMRTQLEGLRTPGAAGAEWHSVSRIERDSVMPLDVIRLMSDIAESGLRCVTKAVVTHRDRKYFFIDAASRIRKTSSAFSSNNRIICVRFE